MTLGVQHLFGLLGHTIGSHPVLCILLSLSLFGLSLLGPMLRLEVKMNIKSGFTRGDAASVREIDVHKRFFNSTGDPWYMALFAVARNNGSILETARSDELTTFYKDITQVMSVSSGNQSVHYQYDLCKPFCNFNSQLWNLLNYQSFFKLRYPLSTAGPFKVNIGKYVFNRSVDERGMVVGIGTAAIYFTTFITNNVKRKQLNIFEEGVLREIRRHNENPNNTLTFVLHGAHTVGGEVRRGVGLVVPYYLFGAALLVLFVILNFIVMSLCYSKTLKYSHLIFAVAANVSPILAALSATGLVLLVGFHINMLILISPFLTLAIGIGVDDAFLLTNTWLRQSTTAAAHNLTPAERSQMVLEKVGAGMTVTSLTNVLGFALGCIAPAPEIQLFCAAVALSMLLDLLFQLFFYAPLLVIFAYCEPAVAYKQIMKDDPTVIERLKRSATIFSKYYSRFVASLWAEFIAAGLLITYLYASVVGIQALETNLDPKMLLPASSQSVEGIRIMSDVVWPDYLSINYIIQKPPNFSDPTEYRSFALMVKELESAENSLGPAATMLWVKDYLRYLANPGASKLDVIFGITGPEINDTAYRRGAGLDMSNFDLFIDTDPYTAWKAGVRYHHDSQNRTMITSMLLMIAYKGTSSLAGKAQLIRACREACARYPQYDMVPFDTDAEMVDVILSVPSTTTNTMLFTIGAMGAVFFIFSLNLATSILATLSVASISVGVLGFLKFWGCFLDPLLMVSVIMTAGLSVDFSVHIILHYLMNDDSSDRAQKINSAFHACAVPMLQAGLSTFLIMFPVLFSPIGVYAIISKAIVLVVSFGLLHGLFIVPVVLTALPNCLTSSSYLFCCRK